MPRINYLYFGGYLAILTLFITCSISAKSHLGESPVFFYLYAIGQAALETGLLAMIGAALEKWVGRKTLYCFIGATFLLLLCHFFDLLMDRILDISVWETIYFVMGDRFRNFFFLLDASGIALWIWALAFLGIGLVPLVGIALYKITERIIENRPLYFHPEKHLLPLFCIPSALLIWDLSAHRMIHPDAYTDFIQTLPWKFTFLKPKTVIFPLKGTFNPAPSEESIVRAINEDETRLSSRPNIYLFIVESLRREAVTKETAPHLSAFSDQLPFYPYTLSSANGTNLAWYSIFHSQNGYHWDAAEKRKWQMGSPPLALLKKWGYQIRVYTSAELGYYGLEKLMFGQNLQLLDSYQTFHRSPPLNPADGDADAMGKLIQDLMENPSLQQGQVFLIFLDATHFNYSWPKKWAPRFTPYASEFGYFKAFYSKESIELIKNRYKNAIAFIDSLFGDFLSKVPNYEESIIAFTGDHGEEFFEKGHIFHNSQLSEEQTLIPLYMKLGPKTKDLGVRVVSQIDIFPSIIDSLSNRSFSYLAGESVLKERRRSYAVSTRFNGSRRPYEFFIHNGENKITARIARQALHIRSLRTPSDATIFAPPEVLYNWMLQQFGPAFQSQFIE